MQKFACPFNEAWLIQSTARLVSATLFFLVIWILCLGNSVQLQPRLNGSDKHLRKLGSFDVRDLTECHNI